MGRHGRSGARPAPVPVRDPHAARAAGAAAGDRPQGGRRRGAGPVRTGLLGASAAMAVGAVAVASGLIPGGGHYEVGAGATGSRQVRAEAGPTDLREQGGADASPTRSPGASPSGSAGTSASPAAPEARPSTAAPSKKHAPHGSAPSATAGGTTAKAPASRKPAPPASPDRVEKAPAQPAPTAASQSQAAQVLALVNQERAKAGCSPLGDDSSLDSLAQDFSDEMAARGFFDHTDPDGRTPWDRADAAGVQKLGGENIARGQADAQAVMDAWMNSEGHRANILNCDYTRLGVGVHEGPGGPWWTQDFGF
ncbi:CAP domain-containing protein [Streptomyces tremellae]|uniref:CAP domain-containing protein n=1 Tax=Streptomyces tremellae TaxID=1124239 RepID=A0ABP7GFY5_9ACTN